MQGSALQPTPRYQTSSIAACMQTCARPAAQRIGHVASCNHGQSRLAWPHRRRQQTHGLVFAVSSGRSCTVRTAAAATAAAADGPDIAHRPEGSTTGNPPQTSAAPCADDEDVSVQTRQAAQSGLEQPQGPGFARQLWQLLSPDWPKLVFVTIFTLLSVVCTVSIGPAVGRGPVP